jgi:hypothetical protein
MKLEENVYLGKLFDAYGKLLTKVQFQILDYYLNDDLTISEIGQNLNVSRQAVLDGMTKGEKKLKFFEETLGFVQKIENLEKENEHLRSKLK